MAEGKQAGNLCRRLAVFDLTDFLTWKSCGSLARSACTVTCKWTYLSHEKRWDDVYFRAVGLGQLADEGFQRVGTDVCAGGEKLGTLSTEAAAELGLKPGIAIAAGLIDAHAGGIGTVGARGAKAMSCRAWPMCSALRPAP